MQKISLRVFTYYTLNCMYHWYYADTVVIDWDGYTIGYYGRPFEARNKVGTIDSHVPKSWFRYQFV